MNSFWPLYLESTFNQGLIAVLCLMANQITLNNAIYTHNKPVSVYCLVISRVYLQRRIQTVGMTIHAADQRLYTGVARATASFFSGDT